MSSVGIFVCISNTLVTNGKFWFLLQYNLVFFRFIPTYYFLLKYVLMTIKEVRSEQPLTKMTYRNLNNGGQGLRDPREKTLVGFEM